MLVSTAQLRWHSYLVVQVGEGAVGVESAGVKDGLRGLLDSGALSVGWGGPGEVVLYDVF